VLRGLYVFHEAGVKLGCILLYLDTIARRQRGNRVSSHQHHHFFAVDTFTFQPRQLCILTG